MSRILACPFAPFNLYFYESTQIRQLAVSAAAQGNAAVLEQLVTIILPSKNADVERQLLMAAACHGCSVLLSSMLNGNLGSFNFQKPRNGSTASSVDRVHNLSLGPEVADRVLLAAVTRGRVKSQKQIDVMHVLLPYCSDSAKLQAISICASRGSLPMIKAMIEREDPAMKDGLDEKVLLLLIVIRNARVSYDSLTVPFFVYIRGFQFCQRNAEIALRSDNKEVAAFFRQLHIHSN